MLKRPTTFVLGAGASYDLNFPLGADLRNQIVASLHIRDEDFFDSEIESTIRSVCMKRSKGSWHYDYQRMVNCAKIVERGLHFSKSIDEYLNSMQHDENIRFLGKLAISSVILKAEQKSILNMDPMPLLTNERRGVRKPSLQDTWHIQLVQMIFDGHSRSTINRIFDDAAFIIFNYDRCLERFLAIALSNRFDIPFADALEIVGSCNIIHPYGTVGSIQTEASDFIDFGDAAQGSVLSGAAKIRTFTEAVESETAAKIKDMVARSEILAFMGFGWLPQNVDLLSVEERDARTERVFATALAMADGEVFEVEQLIDRILSRGKYTVNPTPGATRKSPVFIDDRGDCNSLMKNCWLRLTR